MTSLCVEFRHFEAITERLSLSDGLRLVGVTSSTTLAMGNWEDDYRRWGALVCFSVGLKWNISPRTAWEVTYELKGGAMLSDEYSTPNPNVTLPAPGNIALFGQCLTIGATTSF